MKTRDDTHVPLPDFPAYTVDEMQARAAAFHAAMLSRRSVRAFSDTPVAREVLEHCVLTAGS
ncbi:MAG: iodotyrosine deiodinase, partial [Hyphomonas sp.]